MKNTGVKHVFLVTGGALLNITNSFDENKNLKYICNAHEQGAAIAAEAYSRITKNLGVAMATSGPGATNLITGICCAYFDSIPTLYITGQVNTYEQTTNNGPTKKTTIWCTWASVSFDKSLCFGFTIEPTMGYKYPFS